MTLLEIVQEFCRRTGLTVPNIVMKSNDDQLLQIVGLLNEGCSDLVARHNWKELTYETTFNSLAGEFQGKVVDLAPNAFYKILNDTIYDRSRRLPVFGPRSPQTWQQLKALPMSGPYYQYRVQMGGIYILPAMPAGHLMAFEYQSKGMVTDNTTAVPFLKPYFTFDDDTFTLNQTELLFFWLRWRWKEEKGLPYAEAFRLYEVQVAEASNSDGTAPVLDMAGGCKALQPGIFVPAGNWNQ